jgi:hypothetical protein
MHSGKHTRAKECGITVLGISLFAAILWIELSRFYCNLNQQRYNNTNINNSNCPQLKDEQFASYYYSSVISNIDDTILRCNTTRRDIFLRRNPTYSVSNHKLQTALPTAISVLQRLNVNFFIVFGTLLGWARLDE